jgi:hypothetical protein
MTKQNRRYTRFLVEKKALAALGIDYAKVGKIQDISMGGLAFEYLNKKHNHSEGLTKINIFIANNSFNLPDITCRIVCDCLKYHIDQDDSGAIQKNKCAVEFLSLSDFQKDQIDFFIKNHTAGIAP